MSDPIIISDDEDQKTPVPSLSKKPRTLSDPLPTILVLDDDPTPKKFQLASSSFSSTPSFVAETPMSDLSIVKCTKRSSNSQIGVSNWDPKPSGYLFTFSFFCLGVGGWGWGAGYWSWFASGCEFFWWLSFVCLWWLLCFQFGSLMKWLKWYKMVRNLGFHICFSVYRMANESWHPAFLLSLLVSLSFSEFSVTKCYFCKFLHN